MKKLVVLFLIIFLITNVYASCNETQIDINTANAEDLDKIIWVGPVTADKIISYREENIFDSLDELINVSGIGEKKLINITEQGLACVDEEIQDEEEENSEESEQTFDKEEDTNEIDEEDEEEKEDNQNEDEEPNVPENIYVKNLTLKTIELNSNSKDIKSVDNKKILKRNLAFAGIVTFCVTFGGALFLLNTRRRKSEFN